jgi:hypothetical protein
MPNHSRPAAIALAALLAFVPAAAAAAVPAGEPVDGVRCEHMEAYTFHVHVHLVVARGGVSMRIPEDVGQSIVGHCLYWLHTHTPDGVVHVESPIAQTFTLGMFLDIWGKTLGPTEFDGKRYPPGAIAVWVNGRRYSGDPRAIEFANHSDIVVQVGPPHVKPKLFTTWASGE